MASALGGKEGFTLIGVLVFCLILIPVCATLARSSRDFAHDARNDVDKFRQAFLATGIADAVATKIDSDGSLFDRLNGKSLICTLFDNEVILSLRDHDGKIDLNNAASELLIAGFEAAGLDSENAVRLQQFVEASRSNGMVPREIFGLVEKLSLKHAPFEHVEEVQDILAALDAPAIDAGAFFTVDRGTATVEETTAPQALRARLKTLANQGVVFEDNGTFDYVDILVGLRPARSGREMVVAKTYRKISPMGDVIEIRSMRLPLEWRPTSDLPRLDCVALLGFREEA